MKTDGYLAIYSLMGIGLGSGICIIISIWLGYLADSYFNISPYGIIAGIVLGLASAVTYMLEQIKKCLDKIEKKNEK